MTAVTSNGASHGARHAPGKSIAGNRILPAIPLAFAPPKRKGNPQHAVPVVEQQEKEELSAAPKNLPVQPESGPVGELGVADSLHGVDEETKSGVAESTSPGVEESPQEKKAISRSEEDSKDEQSTIVALAPKMQDPPPVEATLTTRANELPPPFVPSNISSTPSVASGSNVRFDTQPQNTGSQQSRPSPYGVVFGSYGRSEDSSPAPPTTQASQPPQFVSQPYTGPHPGSAPFVPSGHSYHSSEPSPSFASHFTYGPLGVGQGRDSNYYGPAHFARPSYGPPPGRYPAQPRRNDYNNFSPRFHPAGVPPGGMYSQPPQTFIPRGGDTSQASSRAIHPDIMRDGMPNDIRLRQQSMSQPDVPPNVEQKGFGRDDTTSIVRYLCSQFGQAEFADYVVQLSHSNYQFPPRPIPAHGLILARSPKLRSLMAMPHGEYQNGLKVLSVPISDRFLNVDDSMMRALMHLYGDALPDRQDIVRLAGPLVRLEAGSSEAAQMRFALALAAAGHFLQIDEIISHALLLAGYILSWFTLGKALAFALEGGLSTAFTQTDSSSKDKESNSSFDGPVPKPESPISAPAYGIYSDRLLNVILSFLVHNIPVNFKFSANAPQINDPPRLPFEAEPPKHVRSASRLSQIRFGEMTLENPNASDPISEIISSILVSLPFALLRTVSESNVLGERLGWQRVAELVRAVTQEREQRRLRAMLQRGTRAGPEDLWRAVRWVESIETTDQHPLGIKLIRTVADADTPPSTESGQS